MDELLQAVKEKIATMKKIENAGFTNTETATAYFQEKEIILEGIVKTLETMTVQETAEVEALKSTVKALREEIKGQAANPRELTRRELLFNLGKGISAAWSGNNKALAELSFSPNLKADNWTNPRDVTWGEKGWQVVKAPSKLCGMKSRGRLQTPGSFHGGNCFSISAKVFLRHGRGTTRL